MAFESDLKVVSGASAGQDHAGGGMRFGSGTINGQPLRILDLSEIGIPGADPQIKDGAAINFPDGITVTDQAHSLLGKIFSGNITNLFLIFAGVVVLRFFVNIFKR